MAAETPTHRADAIREVSRGFSEFSARKLVLLALVVVAASSGCVTGPPAAKPQSQADARVLVQTDKDFCALAQKRGVAEAFRAYAAEDATLLPQGEAPTHGREAIFTLMASGPEGLLTWMPVAADLARCGDLGYTWGTYEFRGKGADGQPFVRHGKYVTVWKRQPDGSWKYVVDIGNPSPPPE